MQEYLDNGARLGWLIDPVEKRVHVYRPDQPVEVLDDPATLSGDPVLPGFIWQVRELW
jgi:Uma2 family endonuclease